MFLMSNEPIFAALSSVLILGENLSIVAMIGGVVCCWYDMGKEINLNYSVNLCKIKNLIYVGGYFKKVVAMLQCRRVAFFLLK
ncbi:hypothetical protein [Metabacillus sp. RGM 3146]|uniref:hypothetical protein n=1 Tax=Metabacillus sp. RGM 3146 TaxID=3401092 RepID=UPI003B9D4787